MIWQVVRNVRPALLQMARIAINRIHVKNRRNWREDRALQPRRRLPVRTQSRLHIHGSDGVVIVELDVVLSSPDHLHWPPHFFGQNRSLSSVVGLRLAPKSPTEKRHMAHYGLLHDRHLVRDDLLLFFCVLRRCPYSSFADLPVRE